MEYRLLGNSGLKTSVLSFGTATFGGKGEFFKAWGSTQVSEARRLVDICMEGGINMFDTANGYSDGAAEEILGETIKGKRDKMIISTKANFPTSDYVNDIGSSRSHLIKACEDSLQRLKTDYIDLYYMHAFDASTPIEETLRALDDLIAAGKIRYIGCSNFSGWHLMKSLSISEKCGFAKYIVHQVYYSLIGRELEWELMPLAKDQNIGNVIWSPLAGGFVSGKIGRNKPMPKDSRAAKQGFIGSFFPQDKLFEITDALEEVAGETGRSVAEVALNWVVHRPTVSSVIIGARNEQQLKDNLKSVEFKLTPTQVEKLDKASEILMNYPYWHQFDMFKERNPWPVNFYKKYS